MRPRRSECLFDGSIENLLCNGVLWIWEFIDTISTHMVLFIEHQPLIRDGRAVILTITAVKLFVPQYATREEDKRCARAYDLKIT